MILLSRTTDLQEERRRPRFRTILHKIRAHTNIRGNGLPDAAAKMSVTQYNSLPESHKLKIDVGEVGPCPPHWVMYTVKPPPPSIWRRVHEWLYCANSGGRFLRKSICRCTLSRVPRVGVDFSIAHMLSLPLWRLESGPNNSDTKLDMRSYVASTTLPYIAASFLKT